MVTATDWAAFERDVELRLLLEAGRDHPVPAGWEPLPPCGHEWVEVTLFGDPARRLICRWCPEEKWAPW